MIKKYLSDGIEIFVNIFWNALDLSLELIFDGEQILLIIFGDEVDGETKMSESSWSTDSVQICLSEPWKVKIDDNINRQNIDTTGKNVCTDQAPCLSVFEVMINPIRIKKKAN